LFFGGTPALVSAIYLAISDVLDLKIVVLASVVTTTIWDGIWYSIGRFFPAAKITELKIMRRNEKLFEKMNRAFSHRQYLALFFSRFIYGINSIYSIACGVRRMQYPKFFIVSMLSILATILVFTAISLPLQNVSSSLLPYAPFIAMLTLTILILSIRFLVRILSDKYLLKENEQKS